MTQRPREKLLKRGVGELSITELIAVILTTGTRTKSVLQHAHAVARAIKKTSTITREQLLELGLGPAKSAQILAALELSRRIHTDPVATLTSPEQVYAHCYEIVRQEKESLICFYLNARGELLKREVIAVGTLNTVKLLPRDILSLVKELPVASIILAHNHPSGSLIPSHDDILFTKRMKAAAELLGVQILDHLIVATTGWKRIPF